MRLVGMGVWPAARLARQAGTENAGKLSAPSQEAAQLLSSFAGTRLSVAGGITPVLSRRTVGTNEVHGTSIRRKKREEMGDDILGTIGCWIGLKRTPGATGARRQVVASGVFLCCNSQ